MVNNVFGNEVITVKCPIMDFLWFVLELSKAKPPEEFNMDSLTRINLNKKDATVEVDIKRLPVLSLESNSVLSMLHKYKYLPISPPFIIGLQGVELQRTEEIIRFYVRRLKT